MFEFAFEGVIICILFAFILAIRLSPFKKRERWTFEKWQSKIHYEPKQVERILRAQEPEIAKGVIAIDKKNQIIVIQGTEEHPYIATPVSCTCQDFAKRRLPCKHIYRLAIELGELGTAVRYAGRHKAFSPITDMQKYRELYNAGTISRETFDKMCEALESAREDEKADSFLRHFE